MDLNDLVLHISMAIAILGIFLIFKTKIGILAKSLLIMPEIPKYNGKILKSAAALNGIANHLCRIFNVISNGKNVDLKVKAFMIISSATFVIAFYFCRNLSEFGALIAVFMGMMPYGYIRLRMSMKQVKGSFEGQMLLDEIVNQYKICGFDIYSTIDRCVENLPEESFSKKALFRFAIKMRTYVGEAELKQALNEFAANFDTIWARMLADNFYNAIRENVNVLKGLEDLLEKCKEIDKFIEESKKEGREADMLIKILCPISLVGTIFMAKNLMGFSWQKIITYQFVEMTGVFLFAVIVLAGCINIIVLPLLYKRKYDL